MSRLESLVFLWLRRVYGGNCETSPFRRFPSRLSCRFAWAGVALCDIPTCLLTCRKCQNWRKSRTKCSFFLRPRVWSRVSGFLVASPCLWGKLQNISFSKVSKQVVMSFCVAGVALREIPTCLKTCRKLFCVAGATIALHTLHSTLYTPHSTLYTPPHSTLYTLHTPHSTLYTPHFTLHTPHFTLRTPHSTLYTLHSKLYTAHSTIYTLDSSLHTLHITLQTPHCTLHSSLLYTLHTHTPHSSLKTPLHSTLLTLHSTLHTPHSTLYTLH